MEGIDYHSTQILKILEYLRDKKESKYTDRAPFFMSTHLSMDSDYLKQLLNLLEEKGVVKKANALDPQSFSDLDIDSDIFMYYDITNVGKMQLTLGVWKRKARKKKSKKTPLTTEERLERRKSIRETIQFRWFVFASIGTLITLGYLTLIYFWNYDVLKEIKSWMNK